MSLMRDYPIENVERLGYLVRQKRQEKSMSQAALAALLGVERKWVLKLEAGNAGAELGLVLKALEALGLHVILSEHAPAAPPSQLDEVFRRLQRTDRK
jgi:HTH-type transcriptional regulator/antitoxin HipB